MERKEFIMKRVQEHYDYIKDKFEVVGLFLQGSQNYELDIYDEDYKSDIDTKAIVLPSLNDIVLNIQPVSTTLVLDNEEHIDVKDIRIMFDVFLKQNVNFIEILFSDFYILNPKYEELILPLLGGREDIAFLDFNKALNCQAGMSQQKLVALKHPYPTIVDKINKHGYDPKQLHHILRMNDFIKKYVQRKSYKESLVPNNKDYLISVKKGEIKLQEAEELAVRVNAETYEISKQYQVIDGGINQSAIDLLNEVKYKIIEKRLREELK